MQIQDLHLLLSVARLGSFAAAARQANLDPSSVSRSISSLEADLGFRLFQRSTRRLSLTEAGRTYCGRIEPLLEELAAASEQAMVTRQSAAGRLRMTASVAYGERCLVPLLPRFRSAFPKIQLELLLTDRQVDLVEDTIDLAVRHGPAMRGDLITVKLHPVRYRVCASPDYLKRCGLPPTPKDLTQHDCVRIDLPEFRDTWHFRDANGAAEQVPITGSLLLSSALSLRSCTLAGLGPSLLADWLVAADIEQGGLVDLFPEWRAAASSFDSAIWLLYPSRHYLPVRVRMTIDFLRQYLNCNLNN